MRNALNINQAHELNEITEADELDKNTLALLHQYRLFELEGRELIETLKYLTESNDEENQFVHENLSQAK